MTRRVQRRSIFGPLRQTLQQLWELRGRLSLRGTLDTLPDAILVTDAAGCILRANFAAAQCFGVAQPAELRGRPVDALLAQRVPSLTHEMPALAPPQPGAAVPVRRAFALETPASTSADEFLVKGVPRQGDDGRFLGWIVTVADIGSVRDAQRRRDEALRFISHDIRAPQAAILTLIEMQRHRGAATDILDRVEVLARQSLALADGFLQLARAETGIHVFELANLSDLMLEAADQLWAASTAAHIQVDIDAPPDPAWCPVERSLVTRALGNVLGNAIKFSPRGSRVHCSVVRDGAVWCISVADQGIGVAPHEIPKLFQRFRRLEAAGAVDAVRRDGAGLGLAFVKAVVMQHRGSIEVFSAVGQGTEIRIRLPALAAESLTNVVNCGPV